MDLTPLKLDDGLEWRVDRPVSYHADNGDVVHVETGFVTDLASIPRALWIFWPPEGLYTEPAVVHDQMYRQQAFTRLRCDQIFMEAMTDWGVGRFTRWIIFAGVRAGGWAAWNQHKKENADVGSKSI